MEDPGFWGVEVLGTIVARHYPSPEGDRAPLLVPDPEDHALSEEVPTDGAIRAYLLLGEAGGDQVFVLRVVAKGTFEKAELVWGEANDVAAGNLRG
jgi:hypothetical protein